MAQDEKFFEEPREQSLAKSAIVSKYFKAWATIMLKHCEGKIAYIDLFAGAGQFDDGTPSTPLRIIELATTGAETELRDRLLIVFNDENLSTIKKLREAVKKYPGTNLLKHFPQILNTSLGQEVSTIFDIVGHIPKLSFIDPWGYKGLSLDLLASALSYWGSDCIVFFNYNRINPAVSNELVFSHIEAIFGKERATQMREQIRAMPPVEREYFVLESLSEALGEAGGDYVLPFRFKSQSQERTSHYLVFVSRSRIAYDIMKKIMRFESNDLLEGPVPFEYLPISNPQLKLLHSYSRSIEDLCEILPKLYRGQTLTVKQVFDQHNVGTPYIMKDYQASIKLLEGMNKVMINPPKEKRRANTLAPHLEVEFPK